MFLTLLSAGMLHRVHTHTATWKGFYLLCCFYLFIRVVGNCWIPAYLPSSVFVPPSLPLSCAGLSLVVGLVLYISSINDEVMNRPREPEQFFNYHYGWSFAFAASSFLLKEVSPVVT